MSLRFLTPSLLTPVLAAAMIVGCGASSPTPEPEEHIESAEQAITDGPFAASSCGGAEEHPAAHNSGYPVHAPGLCPATPAYSVVDATAACGGTKVKYFTYGCDNFQDGTHAWTSYFSCCPNTCAGSGITFETRKFSGAPLPASAGNAVYLFNHLPVGGPGYGIAALADTTSFSNHASIPGGAKTHVASHLRATVVVPQDQAGTWTFRLGPDYGHGGTLLVDWEDGSGVELESYWKVLHPNDGVDLFWGGSWANPSKILQGSIYLAAGTHVIDAYGFEDGSDGSMSLHFMAPGTGDPENAQDPAFRPLTPQNLELCGAPLPVQLAGGWAHSLALSSAGTVWAWGHNGNGRLGDGTTTKRLTPVQVNDLQDVTFVAAGLDHSLALRSDGTVWSWGDNLFGQLGDGSMVEHAIPLPVSIPSGVSAISARGYHSIALKDGAVWAWGRNSYGALGDGSAINRPTPVEVPGLSGVVAIGSGEFHSVALAANGTVWAWGFNEYGQLGDGTTINRTSPVQVSGLDGITAIVVGKDHAFARRGDGSVWAWGRNFEGQLGDGSTNNRTTPINVGALAGFRSLAAGGAHTLGQKADGSMWAWGQNMFGQVGDGSTDNRTTPVLVSGLSGVTSFTSGLHHSLALKADGSVWAWGRDVEGQLGDGVEVFSRVTPIATLMP
jgi:alpha-tubulin suppressor-like RCC1 family protein